MVELGLLALMAGLSLGTFFMDQDNDGGDDDGADPVPDTDQETAETPAASTVVNISQNDGVDIQVPEDETRSLAVIYFKDTQDDPDDFVKTDEARFYLVPEDVDWSSVSWETQVEMPDAGPVPEGTQTLYNYNLPRFEEHFGLELIATVDLKGVSDEVESPADRLGGITSNVPIEGYYLEAVTDGDNLGSFLPEDYVELRDGLAQETVTEDTTGSDFAEWFYAETDGLTIDGAGGDDILESAGDHASIIGGAGDDRIDVTGVDTVIDSGAGDDQVTALGGTFSLGAGDDSARFSGGEILAHGGAGDDTISAYDTDDALIYGETGDDNLNVSGIGAVARGGGGADFVSVNNGAKGYGGTGDDHLSVDSGSTGVGGAGDDLFTVWNFFRDEDGAATVTGGEGADTFDAQVRNAYRGETDDIYMRITDFNPDEDVLQVGVFSSHNAVKSIDIVEAEDGTYTDVMVKYKAYQGIKGGVAVIRLDGTPGITPDQIVITD